MDQIKSSALIATRKTAAMVRGIQRYFFFILRIILWVVVLYIITPGLATIQPMFFGPKTGMTSADFILLITAAFILASTYETQKLKEESVFQRRMAVAHDVRFRMRRSYIEGGDNDTRTIYGTLTTTESQNNICKLDFISAIVGAPIGRSAIFQLSDAGVLSAEFFILSQAGRDAFLEALQLGEGEIRAAVLVTNGEHFTYTFRAVTDNWKRAVAEGVININDEFILVKKELDES